MSEETEKKILQRIERIETAINELLENKKKLTFKSVYTKSYSGLLAKPYNPRKGNIPFETAYPNLEFNGSDPILTPGFDKKKTDDMIEKAKRYNEEFYKKNKIELEKKKKKKAWTPPKYTEEEWEAKKAKMIEDYHEYLAKLEKEKDE